MSTSLSARANTAVQCDLLSSAKKKRVLKANRKENKVQFSETSSVHSEISVDETVAYRRKSLNAKMMVTRSQRKKPSRQQRASILEQDLGRESVRSEYDIKKMETRSVRKRKCYN